ncbi:MAG TPA: MobF family relaxase [Solirubrobacterales bacterium]|jgi:conjugative relaxase-like TrwC/TraI family protein|nr:MobF family relaxase [Solirubrobacterales bacterium]
MLSIGKLGKGQERYYLEKVAEGAEDYYSGEGEEPGQWLGDAARELGLSGEVEPDQLVAMLTGMNPATGEPLGLRAVPGKGPVPGFDLTFSAPKSVSLTWALAGEEVSPQVKAAHQRSVEVALAYMERHACLTRRSSGDGGRVFLSGNGFLAAAYLHRSSRNGDPQLHTHVLIANATKGPDGKWTRLYHPAIYDHAKTAGYIYEAHLRHELTRTLGIKWQPVRNSIAEIKGFKDEWLKAFSTRRAEILEAAGADGSARARQVATLATRDAKEKGLGPESLRERWHEQAKEIGLDRDAIAQTMGREVELAARPTLKQLDRKVTAHASHFDRRGAIQAVANSLSNGAPAHEVEAAADAFLASDSVVTVAETAKGTRYTTKRIWELERQALEVAERMAREVRGEAGELVAARVIASRPTLNPGQREMVRRLLAGHEGIAIVIGEAGTGKSFATVAAAEGWAQAGFELRVAAPTWRAANVLSAEGLEAMTVAGLLRDLDRGQLGLSPRSVLLVDEAAMVGSEHLARVIGHADEAGAKLVLVGDPEQLGSIEAGGLFSAIAKRTDPVHLEDVIRHNHELDRSAAKLIRDGQGREALSLYRSEERITIAGNAEERRVAMVEDWWQSYAKGEDALMVAKRNVEVERLNATARELVKAEGRLGSEEIEVGGSPFAAGDLLITRVNDRATGIYNRERWEVAQVDAERGRIVLDGIDQARRVEVGRDYLDRTTLGGEAPALQYAYAVTTYCAQGTTVDRAYVMADPSMDKQEMYVATSRTREQTYLYATPEIRSERSEYAPTGPERDPIAHVGEAAERNRAQTAAHDEALRAELAKLPTVELAARRSKLDTPARFEANHEDDYARQVRAVEERRAQVERASANREAVEALGWRERRQKLPYAIESERLSSERLTDEKAELSQMEPPGTEVRREREIAEQLLDTRSAQALTATRIEPPSYIVKELGERPADPTRARAWDHGVQRVERYRLEHGVRDKGSTFGREPQDAAARAAREAAQRRLAETQRRLGLEQHLAKTKQRTRSIERGLSIGP